MRVLVIVPAFNEERSLPAVAEDLRRHAPGADVCVVDDGSRDGTEAAARRLGLGTLVLPLNLGIGGAVQAGYLAALAGGYDVAVQFDGDGQHDASSIETLLAPLRDGRADFVVGSRFLGSGDFRSTPSRRAGIRYLSWIIRARCGLSIGDVTSGFRAAGRRAIALFARAYPADYPEPEAVALAARAGLRVVEVPVLMRERAHGSSSITVVRSLYYFVKVSLALLLLPRREDPRAAPPAALLP
jgi:glycosyltransferase involved in cell wall biosynthesis